jgi:hypothetical protein
MILGAVASIALSFVRNRGRRKQKLRYDKPAFGLSYDTTECPRPVGIHHYYKSCKSLGKYIWSLGTRFRDAAVGEKHTFTMVTFVSSLFHISIFLSGQKGEIWSVWFLMPSLRRAGCGLLVRGGLLLLHFG